MAKRKRKHKGKAKREEAEPMKPPSRRPHEALAIRRARAELLKNHDHAKTLVCEFIRNKGLDAGQDSFPTAERLITNYEEALRFLQHVSVRHAQHLSWAPSPVPPKEDLQ